jgi:hypothetical protein
MFIAYNDLFATRTNGLCNNRYEYTFTDGSIVTIANGVFGVSYFTDINTFAEKMKPQTKRSIEEETNLGISNEARDFLFAPGSRARSLYDLLPADMPANEKVQQVRKSWFLSDEKRNLI